MDDVPLLYFLFGVPLLLLSSSISICIFLGPTSGFTCITLTCGGGELSLPMSKTKEPFRPDVSLIDFLKLFMFVPRDWDKVVLLGDTSLRSGEWRFLRPKLRSQYVFLSSGDSNYINKNVLTRLSCVGKRLLGFSMSLKWRSLFLYTS